MRILVFNCGSSTLKFELIEYVGKGSPVRLARGMVDRIGGESSLDFRAEPGAALRNSKAIRDHAAASGEALDWLESAGLLAGLGAVGHRVIHGGEGFSEPALIDEKVVEAIERLSELAPLHNQPSLQAIRAACARLGKIPMVAVFDTAFHRTLPEKARRYAIPTELAARHHVERYGFHGLAHRYMMERYCALAGRSPQEAKIITLQLGNGCSAAAVAAGISVDTSMGLTPLEGLVMGTRSGDVDPTLAGFLARREGVDIGLAEEWLNARSGLLGVSGRSRDMRELVDLRRAGDEGSALAIDMFCYRAKKYIGAYLAALGGADAVVFGGGIGENQPEIRKAICSGMEWCGLRLDGARNADAVGREARISADGSGIEVFVIPVDEAGIIARDTYDCLKKQYGGG